MATFGGSPLSEGYGAFRSDRSLLHIYVSYTLTVGGVVASWLVRSSPDRAVRVRALAGDIVLCSWARHLTFTVPLSTQVYKIGTGELNAGGNHASRNTPSRFMLGKPG